MIPDAPTVGAKVGGYRLDARLGEGGMGVVFEATHEVLRKKAAVKMLRPKLCADKESVQRFFNEAVLTASIRHPGIVEVFDYGVHASGSAFIAMALLEGESLEARLQKEKALTLVVALRIARQIAGALDAAHAAGVVHRDLKPDNVFLVEDSEVESGERTQLLDFGIAKLLDDEDESTSITRTGTVLGTPLYMSPEQCRGERNLDGRTDLYALGCMLYQMLSGAPPFTAASAIEVAAAHVRDEPEPITARCPRLAPAVAELVHELLAKSREDRPDDAGVVHDRLDSLLATIETAPLRQRVVTLPLKAPSELEEPEPEIELAETALDVGDPDRVERPLARVALWALAVVVLLGALGGAWIVLAPDEQPLTFEGESTLSCDPADVTGCRLFADMLLRGDGISVDRGRAIMLLDEACTLGDEQACVLFVQSQRVHDVTPDGPAVLGDRSAAMFVNVIVDFSERRVVELYERFRAFAENEDVAVFFTPKAPSERLRLLSIIACAALEQGTLAMFWQRHPLLRSAADQDSDATDLVALAAIPGIELQPGKERSVSLVTCEQRVEKQRWLVEALALDHGTVLVGQRKLRAPFSDDAVRALIQDYKARVKEHGSEILRGGGVQSVRRLVVPERDHDPITSVHVVMFCDPSSDTCPAFQTLGHMAEKEFPDRVRATFRPMVTSRSSRVAVAMCAAQKQGIGRAFLARVARDRREPALTVVALETIFAGVGGDVLKLREEVAGDCALEVAIDDEFAERQSPQEHQVYVNGRALPMPARRPFQSTVLEELELADRLGYGTRVPAAEWQHRLRMLTAR